MAGDRPHEFQLIQRFFAPLANDPGSLGLTDDAAVLRPTDGCELVLSKDMLAADVHFFTDDPPEAIAAKALRVNLSDLAAKGARARGYLLGLALPENWTTSWLERFCRGLSADQAAFDITLYGGDTIRSGNGLQISITAIGEAPVGETVRRSNGKAGDLLFVTGTIGDAAAGLKLRLNPGFAAGAGLDQQDERHLLDRYLLPRPRTALANALIAHATAAMDISDGLIADTGHLALASGVDAYIELDEVPLSRSVQRIKASVPDVVRALLNGGDDYEILTAVSPDDAAAFTEAAVSCGCPVHQVGRLSPGPGTVHLSEAGRYIDVSEFAGFQHF